MTNSIIELHIQIPADLEGNISGQFDEHLKLIERTLNVTLISRDGMLKILGTEQSAGQARKLIEELVELARRGNTTEKGGGRQCFTPRSEKRPSGGRPSAPSAGMSTSGSTSGEQLSVRPT